MAATSKSGIRPWRRFRTLQVCLGLLLLAAAGLKTHQLATEPVLESGILDSRWFLIAVVEFELFLAVWLISGLWMRAAWWAALIVFSVFAVITAGKGILGHVSCGCFGRVPTSPWLVFGVDLAAVLMLWRSRPTRSRTKTWMVELKTACPDSTAHCLDRSAISRSHHLGLLGIWLMAATSVGLIAGASPRGDKVRAIGERIGNMIVVEPQRMVGQRFVLGTYVDIGDQLADGRWLVVFYRSGCSECESLLTAWPGIEPRLDIRGRIALVEIPGGIHTNACPARNVLGDAIRGQLSEQFDWFVASPLLVELGNNRVVSVRSRSETAALLYDVSASVQTDAGSTYASNEMCKREVISWVK